MSKHLPDIYYIKGVDGLVFKDPLSAIRWARSNLSFEAQVGMQIGIVDVIYYGSNLESDMKTTEDLQKENS